MEAITGLLEGFDFTKFLPKIGALLSSVRFWTVLLMYAGPLVLLGFGLWYFLRPAKEANHKTGFRIYYGMGSTEAWLFTQKLAGFVWTILGGALEVISIVISLICKGSNTFSMVTTCVIWMAIQAVLAVASYGAIYLIVYLRYDKDGNPKK